MSDLNESTGTCPFCGTKNTKLSSGPNEFVVDGKIDTIVPCCSTCLPNAHRMIMSSTYRKITIAKKLTKAQVDVYITHYRKSVTKTAKKEKWRASELAMALANTEAIVARVLLKNGYVLPEAGSK